MKRRHEQPRNRNPGIASYVTKAEDHPPKQQRREKEAGVLEPVHPLRVQRADEKYRHMPKPDSGAMNKARREWPQQGAPRRICADLCGPSPEQAAKGPGQGPKHERSGPPED